MSTDEAVSKDLIETLEDGREGFAKAAEQLATSDTPALAETLRGFSDQRAAFSQELRTLAKEYGDHIEEGGSVVATFHRGWMALKDALSGSSPAGVLGAAGQGEDHAVKEYEDALTKDLSPTLRQVVERQLRDIRSARDQVKALHDKHS